MKYTTNTNKRRATRIGVLAIVGLLVVSACSGGDDASSETTYPASAAAYDGLDQGFESEVGRESAPAEALAVVQDDGSIVFTSIGSDAFDAKVVRDGRIDVRIPLDTFDAKSAQVRAIATELGGYVASGESYVEQYEDDRYAVGWVTLKIPSDRFEDAVDRVERLGERVSSSLSSQDVTEEYVDLEGRLSYWEQQEQFYSTLLDQAESIDDLVTIQSRMQEVLLNIEQIEGRLRYLDGRTEFATLTVGLTEVPVLFEPQDEGTSNPIQEAFEQAGDVLLATVGFLIIAAAVAIPIALLVLFAWLIFKLFTPRRKETAIDNPSTDEPTKELIDA
jgi:hypothetical protein